MEQLEAPDTHCLSAATGWLELGCRAEAKAELDLVSAAQQWHPDVLEVWWAKGFAHLAPNGANHFRHSHRSRRHIRPRIFLPRIPDMGQS
jgi:hypothetical protein